MISFRTRGRRKPGPDEDRIVEYIRQLMAINMATGDIKRTIVANTCPPFDKIKSTKTLQPYLRLAAEAINRCWGEAKRNARPIP